MIGTRLRDERGLTIPIVALLLGVLVLMVSFAVDLGRLRSDRRLAQAGADVIALDMMRIVGGRTFKEVVDDPNTLVALSASATRNGFTNAVGTVADSTLPRVTAIEWGTTDSLGDGDTFEAFQYGDPVDDVRVPTAVRITTERTTDYFFQPGSGDVERTAIAAYPQPNVDVEIGSVAAGFQPTVPDSVALDATVTALNARLAAHFGATVPNPGSAGFDLVGYRGLAAADVDLWRVAANAGFASPNEMLASDMTVGQLFDATATALDQQAAEGDPNAAGAAAELRRFQTQMGVDNSSTTRLGDSFAFETGGDEAAAEAAVNVLDLLVGGANVINGENFVSYEFATAIPGVAIADVDQHLVQSIRRRENVGVGATVETQQLRLAVELEVLPLAGMPGGSTMKIPLIIEAATADGTVTRIDCADPIAGSEAEVGVVTSGARVRIGTTNDLTANALVVTPGVLVEGGFNALNSSVFAALGLSPLQLLGLDLNGSLTATGTASVLGGSSTHVFNQYADPNPHQRAPGGIGATSIGGTLSSTLSASLGGAVLPATAQANLANELAYVFDNVEELIVEPLLKSSGVAIAGADVLAEDDESTCEGGSLKLVG
jgi:uncharacterized membrane protein